MSKLKVVGMIPLTVMNDIDGSIRSEDGENAGIIEASDVSGTVRDLVKQEPEALTHTFAGRPDGQFTLAPLNEGREPAGLVMVKLFSGTELKTPRGSLRSLRVSSPVLKTVAVTFKFSNPSTSTFGIEVLTLKLGAAPTVTAETTRATRTARREGDILMWVVKAEEATLKR